ncbi:hypothetical protein NUW54_g10148 [Trametes sanguinea]|uniref:Uncharacterized protein n=1 Tax=Trametes sanguinea TaxID=158606 RepID=A0ACC1P1Y3_9APHY|nr:hypothetical protein NUW54_g10148 [Trametes sanguinea]
MPTTVAITLPPAIARAEEADDPTIDELIWELLTLRTDTSPRKLRMKAISKRDQGVTNSLGARFGGIYVNSVKIWRPALLPREQASCSTKWNGSTGLDAPLRSVLPCLGYLIATPKELQSIVLTPGNQIGDVRGATHTGQPEPTAAARRFPRTGHRRHFPWPHGVTYAAALSTTIITPAASFPFPP